MLLETEQVERQAVSGLLARDAWGRLGGQGGQAWGAWETPHLQGCCYLHCIHPLSRLHLVSKHTEFRHAKARRGQKKGQGGKAGVGEGKVLFGMGWRRTVLQ